ncbi:MAG: hypothetical protein Q8K65_01650, partial [Alphaproteobacteria bacterium]|nr:hypothetical protein [Alphaproteobacteria bacterium]
MNRYILSPELHRQIWLRFSWLRVLLVPVALLCIIYSHYMIYDHDWAPIVSGRLLWIYFLLIAVWGTHEASNTLRDEVRGNTWDMQRLTPHGPASLIFGKLFGSTSYVWYASLLTLGTAMVLNYLHLPKNALSGLTLHGAHVTFVSQTADLTRTLYATFFMVMAGVLGHALAFLVSFDGMVGKVEADPRNRRPRTVMAFLAGLFVGWALISKTAMPLLASGSVSRRMSSVNWYNYEMPTETFIALAALFFTFWALVGLWRLCKAEMMYPLTPVYWFTGVAAVSLFIGGLAFEPRMATRGSIFEDYRQYAFPFYIFTATLAATYYAMLAGAGDLRRYGRMLEALRAKRWRRVFENLPQWMASLLLVVAAYVFVLQVVSEPVTNIGALFVKPSMYVTLATTLVLFALRDGLAMHIITALSSSPSQKFERSVYYVFVYFLLPAVHLTFVLKGLVMNPMRFLSIAQGEG